MLAEFPELAGDKLVGLWSAQIRAMVSDAARLVQGTGQLIADLSECIKNTSRPHPNIPGAFARFGTYGAANGQAYVE